MMAGRNIPFNFRDWVRGFALYALLTGLLVIFSLFFWGAFKLASIAREAVSRIPDEPSFESERVEFEVSDKPLLTLEQQRELATMHRTGVIVDGKTVIFEWEDRFPEEWKPYMWGYPE